MNVTIKELSHLAGEPGAVLVDVTPVCPWDETTKKRIPIPEAHRYTVVLRKVGFERMSVVVPGTIPTITPEEVETGPLIVVGFSKFEAATYVSRVTGKAELSAKATGVHRLGTAEMVFKVDKEVKA